MKLHSKIMVLGSTGLVGSAIVKNLKHNGFEDVIEVSSSGRDGSLICDLRNQNDVNHLFDNIKPEYVFMCAARVGGIVANDTRPAEFIYDNLMIQTNVIHAAYKYGVTKLLFMGSSCIYPKGLEAHAITEDLLMSGRLEETNKAYAIAKIAGIEMCQSYRKQYGCNFISVMPTNLYGDNDNYDATQSHVIPALIKKMITAKENGDNSVMLLGDGTPYREFLFNHDLAYMCVLLMQNYDDGEIINLGSGEEVTIRQLAEMIKDVVGYDGNIVFNGDVRYNGVKRKTLHLGKQKKVLGEVTLMALRAGLEIIFNILMSKRKNGL